VNASPLIALAAIGGLGWLRKLFERALVTSTVRLEVLPGMGRRGEAEIAAAFRRRQIALLRGEPEDPPLPELDEGEASTITIRAALAHGPCALAILDDLSARKTARRLGLKCTGTVGVIVDAKHARLVQRARPLFVQLREQGFYIASDVVAAVLRSIGEG